jgi:hypothetical protein
MASLSLGCCGMLDHVWLLVVKYCCGVVVNYNSDTFSGWPNATKCRNTELNGRKAVPELRREAVRHHGRHGKFVSRGHHN